MPAYIPDLIEGAGVLLSIVLIITLIRRGWKMYAVLLLAILVLALTNNRTITENLEIFYLSATSYTALYLVGMVTAIILLGNLHQKTGLMGQLVNNLRVLIHDSRALLMILPATVSLFSTVPGGAVLSAPMVEETGRDLKMPPIELAMTNMVYRHFVTLITPLNPSLVIASGITGISITRYLTFNIPVSLTVFVIATVVLLSRIPANKKKNTPDHETDNKGEAVFRILTAASPYLVALTLGLGFGLFFPLALLIGMIICLLINLPVNNLLPALSKRLRILVTGFNWPFIVSTLAIVLYKDFMLEAESFQQVVSYLVELGLPLLVLIIVLPFITGFITGNNAASLGIVLPVLIPFLTTDMMTMKYFGLIFVVSYAGYLGSPVHLCTYLTNEYFKTDLYVLIKKVNIYAALMILAALLFSFFY